MWKTAASAVPPGQGPVDRPNRSRVRLSTRSNHNAVKGRQLVTPVVFNLQSNASLLANRRNDSAHGVVETTLNYKPHVFGHLGAV